MKETTQPEEFGWKSGTELVVKSNVYALASGGFTKNKCVDNIVAHISSLLKEEIRKVEERIQHQEMARAYEMMKRHRETAKVAGDLLYFTEMNKTVEYMELWAEKLGIDLEKIAKEFYNDDDLEALNK